MKIHEITIFPIDVRNESPFMSICLSMFIIWSPSWNHHSCSVEADEIVAKRFAEMPRSAEFRPDSESVDIWNARNQLEYIVTYG
jgi:hypothetical protein